MAVKRVLKAWVPPAAIRLVQSALDAVRGPEYSYVGSAWAEAIAGSGWSHDTVAGFRRRQATTAAAASRGVSAFGGGPTAVSVPDDRHIREHNLQVSLAYVFALASRHVDRFSVLDWGGGVGDHYRLCTAALGAVPVDYRCVELPTACEVGREVNPAVSFVSRRDSWVQVDYDLVLASSSIHYVRDWRALLTDLAAVSRRYVFVTRMPVVAGARSFVMRQRAYGTEYPGWVLNRDEFVHHAESQGVRLIREFVNHGGPRIAGAPEQNVYMGFLFERVGIPRAVREPVAPSLRQSGSHG